MQFSVALVSTILAFATGISAVPAPTVTIRAFNDITGANADATVPADNVPRSVAVLFGGSAIDTAGTILASSAQLTKFADTTKCTLNSINYPGWVIQLDGRAKNFVDIDGNLGKAIPIPIQAFTFQCTQY